MEATNDVPAQQDRWVGQGPALVEHGVELTTARERLADFFRGRATRAGVLGRRLLGQSDPGDAQLADHLVRERRRRTRIDGSMDGALIPTAWAAWELMDLGCPPDHAAVVRTVGYVLSRQDRPGHFGEGCTPERHDRKLCRHHLSGFFSPASRDEEVAPLRFQSGLVVDDEEQARFAASCFALRVVLRAREDRRASVRRHVESLVQLEGLWEPLGAAWPADLAFLALGALAFGPLEYRAVVEGITETLVRQQQDDGCWPGVHLVSALDTVLSGPGSSSRDAVRRALPRLLSLQTASGAFDPTDSEEQALIALRALRAADR
jgi:hypothetical protein